MKYRNFTWKNEPETLHIRAVRKTQYLDIDGNTSLSIAGYITRTIEGEGVFYGADAYGQFSELAATIQHRTAGTLSLAHWGDIKALLTELEVIEEARENFVRYRFKFLEIA